MKKTDIYHLLPYPIKRIAASSWGYYLSWWRYNSKTEAQVEEILSRDTWSVEKWKNWQEQRLSFLLNQAATKVPYYQSIWDARRRKGDKSSWELLENWPVLCKQILKNTSSEAFLTEGIKIKNLYPEHTSGTTGTPLVIYTPRETLQNWYAIYEARIRRWNGVSKNDRWGIIGGQLIISQKQSNPPFWIWNQGLNQLYLSAYHIKSRTIKFYLDAIKKYRLVYLLGYPSALYTIAYEGLNQNLIPPELELIISNAEPLYEWQKLTIQEFFKCPVKNTYGMSETVTAASECNHGKMHLFPDVGITEVFEFNSDVKVNLGEIGRLICTGLLNSDMPLIRYEVGDTGAIETSSGICSCGKSLPIIKNIEGRLDDIIITPDGRRIGRLDPVFKVGFNIYEAQIIQEKIDSLLVNIVPGDHFDEMEKLKIESSIRHYVGNFMKIRINLVKEIPRTPAGKFKAVISKIQK